MPSWRDVPRSLAVAARQRFKRLSDPSRHPGVRPVSDIWGLDRGTPIDQYYLAQFFEQNASAIRGRVLETGDPRYTKRFGGDRVLRADVLHYGGGNPLATLVGDLVTGIGIPSDAFDCVILVNTLVVVTEPAAALATCRRALREGGVLLAHFTGITGSTVNGYGPPGWSGEGDLWRFTSASARRLAEGVFGTDHVHVSAYGNVRAATAFLYGYAADELTRDELDARDPRYEVVVCARAERRS